MLYRRRLLVVLAATFLVLIILISGIVITNQDLIRKPERALSSLTANVDMHLRGVNYTETNKGRKEWTLKADELRYSKATQRLRFDHVQVALFNTGGGTVKVRGDRAEYDRKTKLVKISGRVIIEDIRGYSISSEELRYDVKTKLIFIDGFFKISGPKIAMEGRDLMLDIDGRRLMIHKPSRVSLQTT